MRSEQTPIPTALVRDRPWKGRVKTHLTLHIDRLVCDIHWLAKAFVRQSRYVYYAFN